VTTKGTFDIVPAIICGSVPTPASRRAAGLPAGGFLALGLGLALAGPAGAQRQSAVDLAARFAQRVDAYEAADKTSPPPARAILLAGDSQFDRWKTFQEDLSGYTVINRGIDSFRTDDLIRYVDRLVIRYQPRLVVLHVGGNDIHRGKTPQQLLADTKTLIAKIRTGLPGVPIAWSSITPGPGRWDEAPQRKAANALVKAWIATENGRLQGLSFIDLWHAMLTNDGQPREDLWVADRVHPNHEGYLVRVRLTTPVLGPPDRTKPAH
jgi:lysophospholipase L1-like esterase